jgi:hypothetical protein
MPGDPLAECRATLPQDPLLGFIPEWQEQQSRLIEMRARWIYYRDVPFIRKTAS